MIHTFESSEARKRFKLEQYYKFLEGKIIETPAFGFEITKEEVIAMFPLLKPHQVDIIVWALDGGRRAIFAQFGLGKTFMQLILAHIISKKYNKSFLIGIPLGVKQEFIDDAKTLGLHVEYVKDQEQVIDSIETGETEFDAEFNTGRPKIFLSNYERIREGNFNPEYFSGVSFDEGDAIRNLDTETTDYILNNFSRIKYRFIATATPSPNDYTEILNYAQFLGVMDRSQALTRFFQRNSTTAGDLTLYPHKEKEFWFWVRSWAIIIQKPSDLGYSDDGYDLPALNVVYRRVNVKERGVMVDRDNNVKMFSDPTKGLVEASKEKRESMQERVEEAVRIVKSGDPDDHWILWHHLEDERKLIQSLLPESKAIFGSQKFEDREENMIGFKNGDFKYLSTKPEIAGSGCNFQKHCHNMIFVGIDYRFKDFIQAIHRCYRYLQGHTVNVEMITRMSEIIREYGLSSAKLVSELKRSIRVDRKEAAGQGWKAIHNDSVLETMEMQDNSVGMIMTSIPFSDQYEYCESYHDMGHNDGNGEFFQQMDFLTEELHRILQPGRIAAIHVKDRIRFSYQNGVGFTSLIDFAGQTVAHFEKHGFHLLGKHFITTDVVMENNQTYRLGWTEQCKDGSKMGAGSPEYLLVFRKAPTDKSNAYADVPVSKTKQEYTRARWQLDAHAYWKSSGNRLLNPEELRKMDLSDVLKAWKIFDTSRVYNHEEHVQVCEELDKVGKLPARFMAIPPQANDDHVWDDINRMNTLNTSQALRKKEKHVCPLQFDIIDRAVTRYSNEGDIILDPFGGIMSVPYRCIPLKRHGIGVELNELYWKDGQVYLREGEYKKSVPTLFDVIPDKCQCDNDDLKIGDERCEYCKRKSA
jgi:DNA modification methylase